MSIKFVDAHTHPLKVYYEDPEKVVQNAYNKGVKVMMVTGCEMKENVEVIEFCRKFDYTWPVIGIHPTCVTGANDGALLETLITDEIKAIGEIGLDYYWDTTTPEMQKESLIAQIKVAEKHSLPVVIHMRDSYEDLYEILSQFPNVKFMIHTWSGTIEWAKKFYELGCYFSFSGIVTYKNSSHLVEVIDFLPVESILTETDAPYLAPAHKRGEKNYSNYVRYVTTFIAGIKKMPLEKLAFQVIKNAKGFFNLDVKIK